jgi:hypothetical protein
MRRAVSLFFVPLALAGCGGDPRLVHPTLPAERQTAIRQECEALLPATDAKLPRCQDIGGDQFALERCRADGDATLLAAARRDQAISMCLRAQGFR